MSTGPEELSPAGTSAEPGTAEQSPIRVAVSGALGRMGSTTCAAVAADPALRLVAMIDPAFGVEAPSGEQGATSEAPGGTGTAERGDGPQRYAHLEDALDSGEVDVLVDFTTPSVVRANVLAGIARRVPVVVGTTGLSAADLADIEQHAAAADSPVLVAPNFAMGAVLMMEFARQAAKLFRACEIVELHHDRKLDAPSGTSRLTRLRIEEAWEEAGFEKDIPIHSVRLPGLVAHQEVIFGSLGETLTIRHDSLSRESFMPGVILAVKRIRGLQGLVVGLENVL